MVLSGGSSVVIAYDTMWGATEQMARAVLEGVVSAGSDAVLLRMNETPNSTAVADLFEAGGMIIGSSTLNSGMLPTMGSLLVYLKGLNPTGKKAAVFGTYGWAGGAQKDMEALLTAAGFELEPGFTCKWKAQEAAKIKKLIKQTSFMRLLVFFLLKRCSRIIYLPKVERSNIIELI